MSDSNTDVGHLFPIMEHFYTLQGEGCYSGRPAYFIRLGGCDVGCHWCDVKESWDASAHPQMSVTDLVDAVTTTKTDLVVVTGGEPSMYDLTELVDALSIEEIEVAIETSGVYELKGEWHWICFSPKKFKAPVESIYEKADELKVVVFNKSDFQWAEEQAEKVSEDCLLYLQPEWDKRDEITPLIIDYVKDNPHWTVSLQTHKYIDIP